mmetsp:Transcript_7679/g.9793  ORF Transcript_7679/g.9793 Transcript_7679/m.9793 type:complete len:629 (-) Transcript_7679:283-2169(-)
MPFMWTQNADTLDVANLEDRIPTKNHQVPNNANGQIHNQHSNYHAQYQQQYQNHQQKYNRRRNSSIGNSTNSISDEVSVLSLHSAFQNIPIQEDAEFTGSKVPSSKYQQHRPASSGNQYHYSNSSSSSSNNHQQQQQQQYSRIESKYVISSRSNNSGQSSIPLSIPLTNTSVSSNSNGNSLSNSKRSSQGHQHQHPNSASNSQYDYQHITSSGSVLSSSYHNNHSRNNNVNDSNNNDNFTTFSDKSLPIQSSDIESVEQSWISLQQGQTADNTKQEQVQQKKAPRRFSTQTYSDKGTVYSSLYKSYCDEQSARSIATASLQDTHDYENNELIKSPSCTAESYSSHKGHSKLWSQEQQQKQQQQQQLQQQQQQLQQQQYHNYNNVHSSSQQYHNNAPSKSGVETRSHDSSSHLTGLSAPMEDQSLSIHSSPKVKQFHAGTGDIGDALKTTVTAQAVAKITNNNNNTSSPPKPPHQNNTLATNSSFATDDKTLLMKNRNGSSSSETSSNLTQHTSESKLQTEMFRLSLEFASTLANLDQTKLEVKKYMKQVKDLESVVGKLELEKRQLKERLDGYENGKGKKKKKKKKTKTAKKLEEEEENCIGKEGPRCITPSNEEQERQQQQQQQQQQ